MGCTKGKENECVMQLMFKYAQHKKANKMLSIVSAFAVPKYPGVIFVEAHFDHQVAEAVENFYFIRNYGIEPIEDEQYHSIFHTVEQERVTVEAGEWVRIKQHQLYQGDLGRLLEVDEDKRIGIVKMVPREKRELTSFSQNGQKKGKNQPASLEDEVMIPEEQNKKHNKWFFRNQKLIESKKFVRGAKIRIQADKGDSDDNKITDDKDETSAYFYGNLKEERERARKDGFICLYTSLSNLVTKSVKPTQDELSYFFPDVKNVRTILKRYHSIFKLSAGHADKIQVGDRVHDHNGRTYRVARLLDDGKLELRGSGLDRNNLVVLDANTLTISFKKYQQVKIVQGEHAGLQGTIIALKDNIATITTDQKQIIQVQLNDMMTQKTVKGNDQQNNAENFVQKIDQTPSTSN